MTMSDSPQAATGANIYPPPADFVRRAHINSLEQYREMYQQSIDDPEKFWAKESKRIDWIEPYTNLKDVSFAQDDVHIRWFEGGKLNACYNCVDRHLDEHGDRTALIFEPDDPSNDARHITYRELYEEVNRFANVLKKHGVKKGDRVTIYLPMIPEVTFAMLACARIGAVHSVVFAGFSPDSLADRILDCDSHILLTADEGRRGGRTVPLKKNADRALERTPQVESVIVVRNTGNEVGWQEGRDHYGYGARPEFVSPGCNVWHLQAIQGCATAGVFVHARTNRAVDEGFYKEKNWWKACHERRCMPDVCTWRRADNV